MPAALAPATMALTVTQAWLLFGVPALVAAVALYTSRSPRLSLLGLLVLLAAVLVMAAVDRISAVALGAAVVLLYAAGRGGRGGAIGEDPARRR